MIELAPKYLPISRLNGSSSKQPRFSQVNPSKFFSSIFRFIDADVQGEPEYGDRTRDTWLSKIWRKEPYLAGVLSSVTSIDKNRGFTITGGRNQVKRIIDLLHNRFFFAPDLSGWRVAFGGSALSYYTSDLGSITEVARLNSSTGPLDSLYFTDPAKCWLSGNISKPLRYNGGNGDIQQWSNDDYFRITSMPATNEELYGLGFCALSRCLELAKIMIGIYQYDNEMLLNRAPRGLLLLKGITQEQWEDAMSTRIARLEGDEKTYYGAVHVLATLDPGVEIEAQLTALSSLPAEFDQQTFTDLLMYGYALCFGYDPREFWPVSSGALGTATETETQHRKAGGKGGLDFPLGFSEKLMSDNMLPPTIQFEFEERDLDGELANAEAEQAKADVVMGLYESGLKEGAPLIDREEARILLAENSLIDAEWTENLEETVATDTEDDVIRSQRTQRAILKFPNEPIVRYTFNNGQHSMTTLLKPIGLRKRVFTVTRMVTRQTIDDDIANYEQELIDLSDQANNGLIDQSEYEDRLNNLTVAILTLAMLRGKDDSSDSSVTLQNAAEILLTSPDDTTALETVTDIGLLQDVLTPQALTLLQDEIGDSLNSSLATDIYSGQYQDNNQGLLSRLGMWAITATGLHTFGRLLAQPDTLFRWAYGATDHCADCARLNGQVHTGDEWSRSGYHPQGRNLACNGYRCQCRLEETTEGINGSF